MRVQRFDYKLAGMRKADNFIVYPRKPGDETLLAQGKRTIVRLDPTTCKGVLNWRGSGSKHGLHLLPSMGAELVDLPKEFVGLCVEFCPSIGDEIGPGITLG